MASGTDECICAGVFYNIKQIGWIASPFRCCKYSRDAGIRNNQGIFAALVRKDFSLV